MVRHEDWVTADGSALVGFVKMRPGVPSWSGKCCHATHESPPDTR